MAGNQATATPSYVLLPQVCGYGYYSYSPSRNQYATQATIDAIVDIAGAWFLNQQTEIGVGDMSFSDGKHMAPHHSHINGRNVDIRPIRKDGAPSPVTITDADYDRVGTDLLVRSLLAHKNVSKILFNDKAIKGVHYFQGHHNHLHVQFKT